MPRKREISKNIIIPEAKYNSSVLTKFINNLMYDGKKSVAERILYKAFDIIKKRKNDDPFKVFEGAMDNVRPIVEVKSRRVGGSTYQVPIEVQPDRRQALAMRWIIKYSRGRSETTMTERLACELLDAENGRGASVKKKEDTHRMAEANKAFAHYRW